MSSSNAAFIQVGSYRLFERIGEGGRSHVHRGEDAAGRVVAIKLLAPHAELDDPNARLRFRQEIATLGRIAHPGVVALLDHGEDDELGPFLVMPLLSGESLRQRLAGRRLGPEAVMALLVALFDALAAIHEVGLVHRDVKPEHLIATPEGALILVDLGLALALGHTRHTERGSVVGSVPYMAPEQMQGDAISSSADVWSAGVMAYEWLTGRRPFARERVGEEAAAVLAGAFTPVEVQDRRVDPPLAALLASLLEPAPERRPTARAAAARLRRLMEEVLPGARAPRSPVLATSDDFEAENVRHRHRQLEQEARAAAARAETLVALALLDRALAYGPNPALRALAEELGTAPGMAASEGAPIAAEVTAHARTGHRWRRLAAGGGLALALVAATWWGVSRTKAATSSPPEPEPAPSAPGPQPAILLEGEAATGLADVFTDLTKNYAEGAGEHPSGALMLDLGRFVTKVPSLRSNSPEVLQGVREFGGLFSRAMRIAQEAERHDGAKAADGGTAADPGPKAARPRRR